MEQVTQTTQRSHTAQIQNMPAQLAQVIYVYLRKKLYKWHKQHKLRMCQHTQYGKCHKRHKRHACGTNGKISIKLIDDWFQSHPFYVALFYFVVWYLCALIVPHKGRTDWSKYGTCTTYKMAWNFCKVVLTPQIILVLILIVVMDHLDWTVFWKCSLLSWVSLYLFWEEAKINDHSPLHKTWKEEGMSTTVISLRVFKIKPIHCSGEKLNLRPFGIGGRSARFVS